jgi:hypothetical protein
MFLKSSPLDGYHEIDRSSIDLIDERYFSKWPVLLPFRFFKNFKDILVLV